MTISTVHEPPEPDNLCAVDYATCPRCSGEANLGNRTVHVTVGHPTGTFDPEQRAPYSVDPETVACPYCGVAAGERCVKTSGLWKGAELDSYMTTHKARDTAAVKHEESEHLRAVEAATEQAFSVMTSSLAFGSPTGYWVPKDVRSYGRLSGVAAFRAAVGWYVEGEAADAANAQEEGGE